MSSGHRKSLSGSILSKLYFLRVNGDNQGSLENGESTTTMTSSMPESGGAATIERAFSKRSNRSLAVAMQQKNRRRKGSLRKTALLGRGAQREKKEMKSFTGESLGSKRVTYSNNNDYNNDNEVELGSSNPPLSLSGEKLAFTHLGLGIPDVPGLEEFTSRGENNRFLPNVENSLPMGKSDQNVSLPASVTSPTLSYTSTTTDEDEIISLRNHRLSSMTPGSGSDSYFPPDALSRARHRSVQHAKSPLSMSGLTQNPIPALESEWDYSETEWWGWVLLFVTWIVFVVGMGSCLGVWSWAWDVGETPYAPPELEDDPTLPIVGYYPALIILTSVMAWVWVTVAWVGMKYFRHTKISDD
ncbi:hypothetical protein HI914_05978 [Erysiphe necator]|uniref:Uncharacterized protein n=1 Tax=Uncinula necator TaxID=52586 RepID=A0A0B1P345_UNCNE|nr:hypothetical protein HI914_05978 [Erysiphe necator]KHJ33122.1 hypothetical protein EV44_g0631 [Erysiphe necator]